MAISSVIERCRHQTQLKTTKNNETFEQRSFAIKSCTYIAFLCYVFMCTFKQLHIKKQNEIDCIYMTSLRYVFTLSLSGVLSLLKNQWVGVFVAWARTVQDHFVSW